jgi:S1-C subfamily serine protease
MSKTQRPGIRPGLRKWLVLGALGWAVLVPRPSLRADLDVRHDAVVEAVAKVMPCVVNVATESVVEFHDPFEAFWRQYYGQSNVQSSRGSGVIISEDGYILTNLHVVRGAKRIQVKLSDAAGGEVYDVQQVYVGVTETDLALLRIIPKRAGERFHAVGFAKDDDLLLGETVIALGNPFGLGESVSRGILSSKSRGAAKANQELSITNWLQTDALINPGNSGGPLIDVRGDLIGINVAMLEGAQGIGFAIPIKEVRDALGQMFTPETASRWFGARVLPDVPLVVRYIDPDSPAQKAGIRPGDTIVEVNGKKPKDFMELNRWLRDDPGLDFTLTMQHEGERRQAQVRLIPFRQMLKQWLGADLQELTPDLVKQLGLENWGGVETGLLIAGVEKGGPVEKAGLTSYCLILAVDGEPLRNYLDGFREFLSKADKGRRVRLSVLVPRTQGDIILGYQRGLTTLKIR